MRWLKRIVIGTLSVVFVLVVLIFILAFVPDPIKGYGLISLFF